MDLNLLGTLLLTVGGIVAIAGAWIQFGEKRQSDEKVRKANEELLSANKTIAALSTEMLRHVNQITLPVDQIGLGFHLTIPLPSELRRLNVTYFKELQNKIPRHFAPLFFDADSKEYNHTLQFANEEEFKRFAQGDSVLSKLVFCLDRFTATLKLARNGVGQYAYSTLGKMANGYNFVQWQPENLVVSFYVPVTLDIEPTADIKDVQSLKSFEDLDATITVGWDVPAGFNMDTSLTDRWQREILGGLYLGGASFDFTATKRVYFNAPVNRPTRPVKGYLTFNLGRLTGLESRIVGR